jgi:membrane protein implicated in regulation of membrane protease activity
LDFLLVLVLLLAVAVVVAWPLYRAARPTPTTGEADIEALEAAKEAKLREVRDAELDYRTGKLSDADWRALDGQLRAEAAELIHQLDHAQAERDES